MEAIRINRLRKGIASEEVVRTAFEESPMWSDIVSGLGRPQKEISSKYFYDTKGSELFEEITRMPEYYLTRSEYEVLQDCMPHWIPELRPAALVEYGAGSARKTRVILDEITRIRERPLFVPVDVSAEFLQNTARLLREEYPTLEVKPRVADISKSLSLDVDHPTPALFALLGSTLGNFAHREAADLLRRIRHSMTQEDAFLMGVDLRPGPTKSVAELEAAYNDAQGVTAEFNLNVLDVINRELGADFERERFGHHAFYNAEDGRMEMHLVSASDQEVHIPGAPPVLIAAGETIHTEISCKYDRPTIDALFSEADLTVQRWQPNSTGRYAMILGRPATANGF